MKNYTIVDTQEKLRDLLSHVKKYEIIAFDTETTSLNPRKGKIIGVSLSGEPGYGYYLPTMEYKEGQLVDTKIGEFKCHDLIIRMLEVLKQKKLVLHNASFDCRFVKCFYGVDLVPALYVDTCLLVHTVKEEGAGFGSGKPFGLKEIAKSVQTEIGFDVDAEANAEQNELKASIKANGGSITRENYEIWKADLPILGRYAAADADLTLRLYLHFVKILEAEQLQKFFFEDEVMPLYREVTIPMEERGVKLDTELITKAKQDIEVELKKQHDIVVKELISKDSVKTWVILKATDAYKPSNKGAFARTLIEDSGFDQSIFQKDGKFSINKTSVSKLPDSPIKHFLTNGDANLLEEDTIIKVAVKLWKQFNDGGYFNIQSKDQMGEIAFGALNITPLSTTSTGKPQFDDDLIQSIFEEHPWARHLRIYNRLLKISSTYIDRFIGGEEDGRYYFSYKQHGTVSGRYGSDAQQLPRVKDEGDDDPIVIQYNNLVRAFFVPEKGNVFIDDDYTSLEPSVFAHVSGDEGLMEIFRKDYDFYSTIAIKTEGYKDYSPDKKAENYLRKHLPKVRSKAKAYALGIPYGMGAYALGKNIGVTTKEAQKLVDGYLNGFPELKKWMFSSRKFVKEHGYIKTQVGRIRHLPKVKKIYEALGDDMLDWNKKRQLEYRYGKQKVLSLSRDFINGLNNSCNVQIQGLAASIVNRAAIAINRELIKQGIVGWVCAQIHDQLIVEVEESKSKQAASIVQDMMENTTKLNVPLFAKPEITKNWRDGHA